MIRKPQVVGDYEIGYECVRLVLRDGDGAEFYLLPDDVTIPKIVVGANGVWKGVVARLLHESFELVASRTRSRYYPSEDVAQNHAEYLFVMDHQQFADCCTRVAEFMSAALPDLSKAWAKRSK